MKKLFTTLFILAGVYTASQAQTKGQFAYGVGVGVNGSYAVQNVDNSTGTSTRIDFNASIQGEYYMSDQWSLKLKAIYDRKGYGNGFYSDTIKHVTAGNVNYNIDYLTLPLLLTWHAGTEKLWYFNAGPYVGILLDASNAYNNANMKIDYNSVDFGADLGFGLQFPLSYKNQKTKFFVEYGWQIGAANILKDSSAGTANLMRQALDVGFRF